MDEPRSRTGADRIAVGAVALRIGLIVGVLLSACVPATPAPATADPTEATGLRRSPATAEPSTVVATHPTAAQSSGHGGSLKVGITQVVSTLDPLALSSGMQISIGRQIYDSLVAIDLMEPRIKPWLAESWQVSPDARSYTFVLKRNVRFHDGTRFDAAAVKANLDRVMGNTAGQPDLRTLAQLLQETVVLDDQTVVVKLKFPSVGFLSALYNAPMISPTAVQTWGKDYGQHPVGTGPFRVAEWIPQDHLVLERNADYAWPPATSANHGAATLDTVTVRFLVDPPARLASLEAGDTQMIALVPLQDVARLQADPRFRIAQGSATGVPLTFYMNVTQGPLADQEVRVGIQHALDQAELIATGGFGQPKPALGLLSSSTRCFSPTLAGQFPHDVALARQLLERAGWRTGGDGIRQRDGVRLAFDVAFLPDYANVAQVLQAELHDVGAELTPKMLDSAAFVSTITNGQANSWISAGLSTDPSVLTVNFHSRGIGSSGNGYSLTRDAALDELLDNASQEPDPARQCMLYEQGQARLLATGAAFPIWELTYPLASTAKVQGVRLEAASAQLPWFQELSLLP